MSNNQNWEEYNVTPSKKFGYDVPSFDVNVFREFRGEIFTTFHSKNHPALNQIHYDLTELNTHDKFSKSYKGVLRGLHYDTKTWKLIQALVGDIYMVVLDMREKSPTFGDWESYLLTDKTRSQILVPPGFANGYYALTDCVYHYKFFYNGEYVNENQQGVVKWNDPEYQIEWPTNNPILQKRDK
jgi:dTDP-4-dehydrorhamnose 3,5-epimerase